MEQKLCPGCEEPEIDKIPGCPLQCGTVQCTAYKKKPIYDFEIMPIVWVMGGPGSGKLIQCQKMVAKYGLTYLSPGELIRQEMASGSDRAKCLNSVTIRGGLVPNDLVLGLLKEAIEKAAAKGSRGFVINGFPREKTQGPQFEQAVGRVSLILYLEASVKKLFTRMKHRPKNSQRSDETPNAMKLRLETFLKHYESIVELYKYRLVKIDADKSVEEIFTEVMIPMDKLMKNVTALITARETVNEQQNSKLTSGSNKPPETETNK